MGSGEKLNYGEILYRLSEELALISFRKKDNTIRTLLCTRSVRLLEKFTSNAECMVACLNGHDKRCNISNGNISAIDMIIEEPRSFNIERVLELNWLGKLESQEEFNAAVELQRERAKVWCEFDDMDDVHKAAFMANIIKQ